MSDVPDQLDHPPPAASEDAARDVGVETHGPDDDNAVIEREDEDTSDDGDDVEVQIAGFPDGAPVANAGLRSRQRRIERRVLIAAGSLSLLIHGVIAAATLAYLRSHHFGQPSVHVALGDQGGDGTMIFQSGADPGVASSLGPSALPSLPPSAIVEQPPSVALLPSDIIPDLPMGDTFPRKPALDGDLLALAETNPIEMTPFGIPSASNLFPNPRHLSASKLFPSTAQSANVTPNPATNPSPPNLIDGTGPLAAGTVPTNVIPTGESGSPKKSTPPRVAARGAGHGASSGRRGEPDGLDSRGLPIADYPAESRRRGEEGLVELDVEVLPDGRIGEVKIVTDSGYRRLNESAVAAVKKASFDAGTFDERPAVGHLIVPYRFVLH